MISRVRKSIRAIRDLGSEQQGQVIDAYQRSLRVTFISAIALFVTVCILVFTIKLPNLRQKDKDNKVDAGGEESESAVE